MFHTAPMKARLASRAPRTIGLLTTPTAAVKVAHIHRVVRTTELGRSRLAIRPPDSAPARPPIPKPPRIRPIRGPEAPRPRPAAITPRLTRWIKPLDAEAARLTIRM